MRLLPLVLILLLLCGCAQRQDGGATPGDLPAEFAASSGDAPAEISLEALLVAENGAWRSEQQRPEDPVVIVRELTLDAGGSLRYREGDWASEFRYFAAGSWTLDGSTLHVTFTECSEDGAPLSDAQELSADYLADFDENGMLSLTQQGGTGFCGGEDGMTVYYHHPIEE